MTVETRIDSDMAPDDAARESRAARDARNTLQSKLGFAPDDLVCLCVGSFEQGNRQRFLIKHLLYLPRRVKVIFVGTGSKIARCKSLAFIRGLEGNVIFAGDVHFEEFLDVADVLVSVARQPDDLSWLEAGLAQGIPAVASDIEQHRALVADGVNGILFKQGNGNELVDALRNMLFDADLCEQLGRNARERASESSAQAAGEEPGANR